MLSKVRGYTPQRDEAHKQYVKDHARKVRHLKKTTPEHTTDYVSDVDDAFLACDVGFQRQPWE